MMRFRGSSWEAVGSAGFSPGSAGSVSLAFDAGVPHVAFIDGGYGQRATVMRYNGSTWEIGRASCRERV